MWSKYMIEVKEYDKRVTDGWKDDSNGVLVFVSPDLSVLAFITMTNLKTGLFSVIVGAFIIESYKRLSPDSAADTVYLLGGISQQLSQLGNGTRVQPPQYPSFSPDHRMIWVNALWLISLVFGIGSALTATLTQQWARRYIQLPETSSSQKDQARVRSYLFLGTQKYYMPHAVVLTIALLHGSVFMFFAGLVIFILAINATIAHTVLITAGVFTLAYLTLTVLPCFAHDCPYRTPMSNIWWYIWHVSITVTAQCLRLLLKLVHGILVRPNTGMDMSSRQRKLVTWLNFFKEVVKNHAEHLKDGSRTSIIKGALKAPLDVDMKALDWFFKLLALADESKVQEFVLSIPGDMVVRLMNSSTLSRRNFLGDHLYALLRNCASSTAGLDEEVRKRHLLMCLKTIHHVAKASIIPTDNGGVVQSMGILSDLRVNVANMGLMRIFWADSDISIRVISRSICALLARQFLRKRPFIAPELAWLQDVLNEPANTIYRSLDNLAAVDSMNIDSFVYGVLSNPSDNLLNDQVFMETLVILMNAGSQAAVRKSAFKTGLSALLRRAEQEDHRLHVSFYKLKEIFEHFFPSDKRDVMSANETVWCFLSPCSNYVARTDNPIPVRQLKMILFQYSSSTL
jgi:Family of unknown function (DUF6535)